MFKRQGRHFARQRWSRRKKLAVARRMIDEGDHTMDEVAATIGVSRATPYRHL